MYEELKIKVEEYENCYSSQLEKKNQKCFVEQDESDKKTQSGIKNEGKKLAPNLTQKMRKLGNQNHRSVEVVDYQE